MMCGSYYGTYVDHDLEDFQLGKSNSSAARQSWHNRSKIVRVRIAGQVVPFLPLPPTTAQDLCPAGLRSLSERADTIVFAFRDTFRNVRPWVAVPSACHTKLLPWLDPTNEVHPRPCIGGFRRARSKLFLSFFLSMLQKGSDFRFLRKAREEVYSSLGIWTPQP